MSRKVIILFWILGQGVSWRTWAGSEKLLEQTPGPTAATAELALKVAEKVAPNVYRIGGITVDTASKEICLSGKINMATGIAEVVVCTPYGKTHESIIVTPIRPLNLHLALLLIGLKNGYNPAWPEPDDPRFKEEGWGAPPGDQVDVIVKWSTGTETKEFRLETLLKDSRNNEPLEETGWVFVGSIVDERGNYLADGIGSIITNYHDGSSVLDCPLKAGRSDDFLVVNNSITPPVDTPVEIRIRPSKKNELPK